ncbi:Cyclin-dependent kinase inhibitor 1B, partial [Stegodyphus mimosarum]
MVSNLAIDHELMGYFQQKLLDMPLPSPTSTRRNLFGSYDSSSVTKLLEQHVVEMAERASRVWNFDFLTESPLTGGRFVWEEVRSCDVPSSYTDCSERRLRGETENKDLKSETTQKCSKACRTKKLLQRSIKGYGKVQKKYQPSKGLLTKDVSRHHHFPSRSVQSSS